ncbi:MAG: hypothetical protein QM499_05490 [Flavobacteriaceae bacterium]
MKKTILYINSIFFLLSFYAVSYSQVGIGTITTPKGALDIESNQYGVVYPSVSLTATNIQAPVINPNGGILVEGTTIYNTNKTTSGSFDVEPGIYSWDGSKWVTHFFKRQAELFEQSSSIRTSSTGGFVDVDNLGITGANTFTARHSGTYKIEVKTNFGAGQIQTGGAEVNIATVEGTFRFIFNGTTYTFTTKAYSSYNNRVLGSFDFVNRWKESYIIEYIPLIEGTTYSFSLEFDQGDATGFINDGNSGNGLGYVGQDIPCFIEITYLKE